MARLPIVIVVASALTIGVAAARQGQTTPVPAAGQEAGAGSQTPPSTVRGDGRRSGGARGGLALGQPGPNVPPGKMPAQGLVPDAWSPHEGGLLRYRVQIRFGEEPDTMPDGFKF